MKGREYLANKGLLPRLGGPHRLAHVVGMTAADWERVYWAYLGFVTLVRSIVAEVEARHG